MKLNPKLDLTFERVVDVPPELVWMAWTQPKHLMPWFCPLPWKTVECTIDLRPGGRFYSLMRGPDGKDLPPNEGCYLEVVENRRLTWTDALVADFRPAPPGGMGFTGIIEMKPEGKGTRYIATALHRDEKTRKQHEEMGFHQGWGTALDQLVAYVKTVQP